VPTNGSDGYWSPEVNVDEFTWLGCTDVLRRRRRKPRAFPQDAGLTLEVGNVLRGDCIETIDSTKPYTTA
jgi:hypothetical protein